MAQTINMKNGYWKHGTDTSYTVINYKESKREVILEKRHKYGIYFTDIKVTNITRKLSKDKTIKVANHTLDLSEVVGIV